MSYCHSIDMHIATKYQKRILISKRLANEGCIKAICSRFNFPMGALFGCTSGLTFTTAYILVFAR